jgi:peptide/nickel transport system substrate-binding protein
MLRHLLERLATLVALTGIVLTAGAFGGASAASRSGAVASAHRFADLRVILDPVDYLDPGLSYTLQAEEALSNCYLSLLGYRRVSGQAGTTVVPVLVERLPSIGDGGRRYTLTLRPGLRYSNGHPLLASDFEATVKRLFLLDSPGSGFFTGIVGATRFARTKTGDIAGIVSDDRRRTIEIRLTEPRGDFLNILALPFAALLPADTPPRDQSSRALPATGPYVISGYRSNRGFTLRRNPFFRPLPAVPATNPDRIDVMLLDDPEIALHRTLAGSADYDFVRLPQDQLGQIGRAHRAQLRLYSPPNTYFFFMNSRVRPFDSLAVRRAVEYAIDRGALAKLYGLARPTQNLLPPAYPSYRKLSLYPHDLARARRLIREAGATGEKVTVWAASDPENARVGAYLTDVLGSIGLKAQLRTVAGAVYFQAIGNQRTRAQIGLVNWYEDYPHPSDWLDPILNGDRITRDHNTNLSNADVATLNRDIERLKRAPRLTPRVNAAWARLERLALEHAFVAPYVNRVETDFFARSMDLRCYVNNAVYGFQWGYSCRKSR